MKSVQSLKTGETRDVARDPASNLGVKPEHMALIKNALVGVNKEGTSAAAFRGAKYVSGGKTGTAQVYSLKGEKYSEHKVDERTRIADVQALARIYHTVLERFFTIGRV